MRKPRHKQEQEDIRSHVHSWICLMVLALKYILSYAFFDSNYGRTDGRNDINISAFPESTRFIHTAEALKQRRRRERNALRAHIDCFSAVRQD